MIKIFTTGGTIDKTYSSQTSDFEVGEVQIALILKEAGATFEYNIERLFNKDSLDMTDDDRRIVLEAVMATPHQRIVITHGTDTMTKTAEVLMAVRDKTIVLTGSMQPAALRVTDADFNVGCAVTAAQMMPPGVYITMNGRVFEAGKVRKNLDLMRFEDIKQHDH